MDFKKFFNEAIRIQYVDHEEEAEIGQEADLLMRKVGVRVNSQKELSMVAVDTATEQVVGAIYSGWTPGLRETEEGEKEHVMMYSWDIGVEPKYQGTGVGKQLIARAMKAYDMDKHQHSEHTMIHLWVINPRLAQYLIKAYGMQVDQTDDNEWILFKDG